MEFEITETGRTEETRKLSKGSDGLNWLASQPATDDLDLSEQTLPDRTELGNGDKIVCGDIPIVADASDTGTNPSVLAQADKPNVPHSVQEQSGAPLRGKAALDSLTQQRRQ
jgi:hypothetical protein